MVRKATTTSSTAAVKVDVYCTRHEKSTDEDERDKISSLTYDLHLSRPDLDAILEKVKQVAVANGESHVAVVGCGLRSMMQALRHLCLAHSDSVMGGCGNSESVFFDLHTEMFEL